MNEEVLCDILCVCVSKLKHTWSGGGVIPVEIKLLWNLNSWLMVKSEDDL